MSSRFTLDDGKLDLRSLKDWANDYFQHLTMFMNQFAPRDSIEQVVENLSSLEFDQLVAMELKNEPPEVHFAAVKILDELVEKRIAQLKMYL